MEDKKITDNDFCSTVQYAAHAMDKVEQTTNRIHDIIKSSTPSKNIRGTVRERRKSIIQDLLLGAIIFLLMSIIGVCITFYIHYTTSVIDIAELHKRVATLEAKEAVNSKLIPILQSLIPLP